MTTEVFYHLIGSAVAAGSVVGALVAIVNSWRV